MKSITKKRSIISYINLKEEHQELFEEIYSEGFAHAIQKIVKPNGDKIFVVPMETDDAIFMVKVDVKIDEKLSDEEFDKQVFGSSKSSSQTNYDDDDDDDDDEDDSSEGFTLIHGDYAGADEEDDEEE